MKKVYIKGVPKRGDEVIALLETYGAENKGELTGDNQNVFYIIGHGDIIIQAYSSEIKRIIERCFQELYLEDNGLVKIDILDKINGCIGCSGRDIGCEKTTCQYIYKSITGVDCEQSNVIFKTNK